MNNVINVLDFNVANLIAAGEVVERPASAIKELVENSIDAGAKNVTVEIQGGGISLMRVTDDGCGMSRADAAMCVKRHATSKLKTGADLNAIMTFGFRGEALAAISAVTKLRIYTKQRGAQSGTFVECRDGKVMTVEDIGCAVGTTVMAEELFANVPARRKFLKKDSSETMAVTSAVEKLALSHPEVSIGLICDGKLRFRTAGDNKLANAVYAVMGRDTARGLISVHGMQNSIGVDGFIGSPELAKKTRHSEIFFVNGRYIRSSVTTAALEEAFQSYIPSGKFPVCVLYITMHPVFVDVNVHPSKLEVKFTSDREVFDAVYSAVRGALVYNIDRPKYEPNKSRTSADQLVTAFAPMPDRTEYSAGRGRIPRSLLDIEYEEPDAPAAKPEEGRISTGGAAAKTGEKCAGSGGSAMSGQPAEAGAAFDTALDRAAPLTGNDSDVSGRDVTQSMSGAQSDITRGVRGAQSNITMDAHEAQSSVSYGVQSGVRNSAEEGIQHGVLRDESAMRNDKSAGQNSAQGDMHGTLNAERNGISVQSGAAAGKYGNGSDMQHTSEASEAPAGKPTAVPNFSDSADTAVQSGGTEAESGSAAADIKDINGISDGVPASELSVPGYAAGISDDSDNTDNTDSGHKKIPDYRIIGVAANAYVFVELGDSVLVIDKHAAHERIIFERMRENMGKGENFPQILMLPEQIALSYEELQAAEDYRDEILATGYDYSLDTENRTAAVTQIPCGVEHSAAADMFTEILARLSDGGEGAELSRNGIFEQALYQASCKAAVKAGYSDDMSHIKWICEQVISNPKIRYCPHGRPVAFEMTRRDIEHRFKRI